MCMADSSIEWQTLDRGERSAPSMFAFIQFVFNAWSWAAVIIASMFFFIYPHLNHCHKTLSAKSAIDLGNFPCKLFSFQLVSFLFLVLLPYIFLSLFLHYEILLNCLLQHRFFWFFQIIPQSIAFTQNTIFGWYLTSSSFASFQVQPRNVSTWIKQTITC